MKNIIISVFCLLSVFIYSFFTFSYVRDFKVEIDAYLSGDNNTITLSDYTSIKNIYENRKGVLRFILNNEYTDRLEESIINLENAVIYDEEQDADRYARLLQSALEDIMYQNKCII